MKCKSNIGKWDKIARFVIAIALSALYFNGIVTGTAGIAVITVAAILFITAVMGRCPIYKLTGLSSCQVCEFTPDDKKEEKDAE